MRTPKELNLNKEIVSLWKNMWTWIKIIPKEKKKNNGTMIFKFQGKTISKLKFYAQTKVK